ncbi:hypothetical protein A2108_00610 [Candidatus Wolfebacteria bacterium GWA1_42_9]|uniref:Uracil-DNA glycosylase-like domain-containing protein n=1 Tax=Candidatus Wolfebacteria bacterium GWA1_42_9 TaxID=1802553 RepID=A0A1F8DL69_9BACT|nr:MAG: phage SPO1 DNA polymerase-related protein [Microgenomates group bacterium GW2011_GWC1_37_12b]KKT22895.1 MAG: phage SPO1 DNA polymerase-related protein [Parcubacteria group bacterium GW2011_GWB1_43_8b]OGM89373.1 MAG: hypothetical protein A2108_00610 [Candidatus Wolfebacteria bacterium GWA1_42_9]
MQLEEVKEDINRLHKRYGGDSLEPIHGAGCVKNPKVMFIFMNPTAKNVSAHSSWKGLRAPWLGTKNVWKLFYKLGVISEENFRKTQLLKPAEWTPVFSKRIYLEIQKNKVYVTNLAKCTQPDARPLHGKIFRDYRDVMLREILLINPKKIITFGNQVSSILLGKPVKVGNYDKKSSGELLRINDKKFFVYPTYYPVGQGIRNMNLAISRIEEIRR